MTTTFVSELARRDKTRIYEVLNTPECQPFLPARAGIGESRRFNPDQAMLVMLHSDLVRWGLSTPFAGRLVSQIAETVAKAEDGRRLDFITIAFYANGASYFVEGSEDGQGLYSPTPAHTGPARFRMTVSLCNYRSEIDAAINSQPQVIGDDDAN